MAPERVPNIVVFNLRIENRSAIGSLEYIEPESTDQLMRVRWAVDSQPRGFTPIGDGVAYIYSKGPKVDIVPISDDARPTHLESQRYQWSEGLGQPGIILMFILILPEGYTLDNPTPKPSGTKLFKGRLALYWILKGDDIGRTAVEWDMKGIGQGLETEILRINHAYLTNESVTLSAFSVDDITDYYITRRAGRQHEKAGRDKQRTESDGTAKPEKAPDNLFQVFWLYLVQPLKGPWRLPVIIVILICGMCYAVWAVQTTATKERFLRFIGLDVQSIRVPAGASRSRDPESSIPSQWQEVSQPSESEEIRTKEQKTLPNLSLKEILNSADNFYKVEHFSKALLEYEKATDLVPFGVKVDLRVLEEARKNIDTDPEKSCKQYRIFFEAVR